MGPEMTKEWLLNRCKAQGLYRTPNLNDRLYLQCQAFCEIRNLEDYTGVKMLYLEENCLEDLDGVQPLKELQCLYVRKNFVRSIDHLEGLDHLDTLDISQNCLLRLDNLSKCCKLRVLMVSHNLLDSIDSIEHLTACQSIMILDISHNKLQDGEGVLAVLKTLPALTVLYLSGNPFVARLPHYRKKLIANLTKLNQLDDRPVFWDERLYAEAWMRGGQEEESAERNRVRDIRASEETAQFEAMRQLRQQHMEDRQYVASRPLLQFSSAELGEDDQPLSLAPEYNEASIANLEDGVKTVDQLVEKAKESGPPPLEDTENLPQRDTGSIPESSTPEIDANVTGNDFTPAEDRYPHYDSVSSTISAPAETPRETGQPNATLQGEKSLQFAIPSRAQGVDLPPHPASEFGHDEDSVQKQVDNGHHLPCPLMFKDLGAICAPSWICKGDLPTERVDSYHKEECPGEGTNQAAEPTNLEASPLPPQQECNPLHWDNYYENPSFNGQQYDDNFLLSLQDMNRPDPNCTHWTPIIDRSRGLDCSSGLWPNSNNS